MIQHTVTFRLKHTAGSAEEQSFLQHAQELAKIPGVMDFTVNRQLSKKNNFTFGLSMNFVSDEAYQTYNSHPDHVQFVETVWIPQVDEFLELDYQEIKIQS